MYQFCYLHHIKALTKAWNEIYNMMYLPTIESLYHASSPVQKYFILLCNKITNCKNGDIVFASQSYTFSEIMTA